MQLMPTKLFDINIISQSIPSFTTISKPGEGLLIVDSNLPHNEWER